jgi:hypothetical protein
MGKSYKRNSYHKPKQRGRIFEKKRDKWVPPKKHQPQDLTEVELPPLPYEDNT